MATCWLIKDCFCLSVYRVNAVFINETVKLVSFLNITVKYHFSIVRVGVRTIKETTKGLTET